MPDYNMLEQARLNTMDAEMPFLNDLREKVRQEKPWQGLTILHNIPLTLITLFKIEVLLLGGADVTTTCTHLIPPETKVFDLLKAAGFKVQVEQVFAEKFDFHLDCGAELIKISPPRLGCIELTQSGSEIYKRHAQHYPLISVDDSQIKILETFFGTGDGFVRALSAKTGEAMHGKSYVVFGNGKVGQGIVYALKKFSDNITVIDVNFSSESCRDDVQYLHATQRNEIQKVLKNAFCTITATGIRNLITNDYQFEKSDFGDSLLVNMGAEDEYGLNFAVQDVEFKKQPYNFSLERPTAFRYLDPVFYCHNIGIDFILSGQYAAGYHPFPDTAAVKILDKWRALYDENAC